MISYNTQLKRLKLPEYGRNIQQMIDYCKTIENRDERNRCAHTIIATMGNLFPELRDTPDYTHKLWDHLAIMADFELDIDFPYEVIQPDNLESLPDKVEYYSTRMLYRHYGISLERMIEVASHTAPGPERDELIRLLANHMKKLMLAVNRDGVDDQKIFNDLRHLSHGMINIRPGEMRLHEFREAPQPVAGKKKKKK